ncbi:MAG: hypothetical protein KC731_13595 [Myxococcales bacterium]|nr:hypothetical protein [Myxococcales bacterium]
MSAATVAFVAVHAQFASVPEARAQEEVQAERPAPQQDVGLDGYDGPGLILDLMPPPDAKGRPMILELGAFGAIRGELVSAIPVDRDGNEWAPGPVMNAFMRLHARFDTGTVLPSVTLRAETEHDVPTGVLGPTPDLEGEGYPGAGFAEYHLRKANVGAAFGPCFAVDVGWMTSHWGMGLLANDGAHGWQPGSARFIDPRGGDRVARLRLMTGPYREALGLTVVLAADILDGDYFADDDILLEGDYARQLIGAVRLGDLVNYGGIYAAYRQQRTPVVGSIGDTRATDVLAIDGNLRLEHREGQASIAFETEAALVIGTTELAPSVDFPEHDVLQFGAAARVNAGIPAFGGVVDFLFASGDQNLDDNQQNAFRPDPNYEMGLLLFRQVLAAQSARSRFTAGDPSLVGLPAENLERLPTHGSAANTIAVFPRLRGRPIDGLEIYGGPLFALAAVPPTDPLGTRSNGGQSSSSLGGIADDILGVELDLGARYRVYFGGPQLTLGVEAGALKPGNALRDLALVDMDWTFGGRTMLDLRL